MKNITITISNGDKNQTLKFSSDTLKHDYQIGFQETMKILKATIRTLWFDTAK